MPRPSFLAIHPNRKYLYAVSEIGTSTVSAFEINPKSGMLTLLNTVPAKGSSACHLVVDRTGKSLVVANYGNGSVAVFPVGRGRTVEREHGPGPAQRPRRSGPGPATRPTCPCRSPLPGQPLRLCARSRPGQGLRLPAGRRPRPTLTAHDPPFARVLPGPARGTSPFTPTGSSLTA